MNFPSLSQWSFAKGTGGTNPPEIYLPLWWYSGGYAGLGGNSQAQYFLVRGGSYVSGTGANSSANLFTNHWSSTQNFALEASIYTQNTSSAVHIALYDWTTNAGTTSIVSGSQISTTSMTMTVVRSGQFTLIPNHIYWVNIYTDSGSYAGYVTDVSLIVFPS